MPTAASSASTCRAGSEKRHESRAPIGPSEQSQPIASRAALLAKIDDARQRFGPDPPRPPRFVGYRVWAEQVELCTAEEHAIAVLRVRSEPGDVRLPLVLGHAVHEDERACRRSATARGSVPGSRVTTGCIRASCCFAWSRLPASRARPCGRAGGSDAPWRPRRGSPHGSSPSTCGCCRRRPCGSRHAVPVGR